MKNIRIQKDFLTNQYLSASYSTSEQIETYVKSMIENAELSGAQLSDLENYAKLNEENTFTENNTFNKNIKVKENVILTDDENSKCYTNKSGFLQADTAYSSSGKPYGQSYIGSKGYCIVKLHLDTEKDKLGLELSGDTSTLSEAFYNNKYLGYELTEDFIANNKNPEIPTYSNALKLFFSSTDIQSLDNDKNYSNGFKNGLSSLIWSVALGTQAPVFLSKIESLSTNTETNRTVAWFEKSYTEISGSFNKTLSASEEELLNYFKNDDNALYVPGLPELGNVNIPNFFCQSAQGGSNRAIGKYSHCEGRDNVTDARYSHAEGYHNVALGAGSHVEGTTNIAIGAASHAEGKYCIAKGAQSHASGTGCVANGDSSIAIGAYAIANGSQEFVWNGYGTKTYNPSTGTAPYTGAGKNTFNINPAGGINGFYIGKDNFVECVIKAIEAMNPSQKQRLIKVLNI